MHLIPFIFHGILIIRVQCFYPYILRTQKVDVEPFWCPDSRVSHHVTFDLSNPTIAQPYSGFD